MAKLLKSAEKNFFFWGTAFLLFFIPVYPKFPLFPIKGTYVHVRLEDIFVVLIVSVFLVHVVRKKDFIIFSWRLTGFILLFFAVGLLSVMSGILITKNIVPHLAFLHFLRRIEYLSLLFVAYYSFKETKQLKVFGWIILISTFLVIFYGLGQKFFGWPVVSTMNKEFSKGMVLKLTWWARVNSTFAGHYDLAAYMVMILPLTVTAFIVARRWLVRILILILGIFSYYILILTASRVSFGAYLASVLLVLIFSKKRWFILPFLTLSILGMIFSDDLGQRYAATFKVDLSFLSGMVKIKPPEIAVIPQPTVTPLPEVVSPPITLMPGQPRPTATLTPTPTPEVATPSAEYFEPTQLAVGRSTDIRLKVEWPRAVKAFLKNPLLGTGYSSITLATDNDYLRMLGETGILGSLAFLAVILEIVRRIYWFLVRRDVSNESRLIVLGISGAAVGYFLNATFIDVFEASKVAFFFWIMMGVGLKIIDLNNKQITQ